MSQAGVTVTGVDISAIPYAAELEVPALREKARRILEAEAARYGVPVDIAEILVRRGAGGTEIHIMAAVGELVLAAGVPDTPGGGTIAGFAFPLE